MSDIHEEVREYMRRIGSKGGKAGKGTELRRKLNKIAAEIRWKGHRKKRRKKVMAEA
jgi:hypothetical protein